MGMAPNGAVAWPPWNGECLHWHRAPSSVAFAGDMQIDTAYLLWQTVQHC